MSGVNPELSARYAKRGLARALRAGDYLCKQGASPRSVYFLLSGTLHVLYENPKEKKSKIIYVHKAPAFLGFLEIWEEQKYLASVRCEKNAEVLELKRSDFYALLQQSHQFCINLLRYSTHLFAQTGATRRVESGGGVEHLLANSLLTLARSEGSDELECSQAFLSEMTGLSRLSVNQSLQKLEKQALIEKARNKIKVLNFEGLRELALDSVAL